MGAAKTHLPSPKSAFDLTTVVAVDAAHLRELRLVWSTWLRHRPELLEFPLLLVCDGDIPLEQWERDLTFVKHPNRQLVPWTLSGASQRDKMLNGLVFATAAHVKTPWYLKLDTDAVALHSAPWLQQDWFAPDTQGRPPVFISSPWGYTKPADAIVRLDEWADKVPELSKFPRLNIAPPPGASAVGHRRIISWCFIGNTAATKQAAAYCDGQLPVPSQDTFLWYVAARRGDHFRKVRMKRYGWTHIARFRRLKATCERSLAEPALLSSVGVPTQEPPIPEPGSAAPISAHASTIIEVLQQVLGSPNCTPWKGAEVGVARGDTSQVLLEKFPHLYLYMVDTWSPADPGSIYFRGGGRAARLNVAQHQANEQIAYGRTEFAAARRILLRGTSLAGAAAVADGSLDFAFIDADHTYEGVSSDLSAWWPKLKAGGVFAGHDYGARKNRTGHWGVNRAVDEFVNQQKLVLHLGNGHLWWLVKPADAVTIVAVSASAKHR